MNRAVQLDRIPTGLRSGARLALTALALISLAACVGPSASSSVAPSSGSGATSAASASPLTASTPANVTVTPTPTATPSSSPTVLQAPVWTGIHWTAGPTSNGLPAPVNTTDAAGNTTSTGTQVFGWSRGFVVFRETAVMTADDNSKSIAIVPYVSADGLTWTKGQPLDVKGLDAWEAVAGLVE